MIKFNFLKTKQKKRKIIFTLEELKITLSGTEREHGRKISRTVTIPANTHFADGDTYNVDYSILIKYPNGI